MVQSKGKISIRECQVCLEKVNKAYILDCAHLFCEDCIRTFCETQFENSNTPTCPVCFNPVEGECLQNLFGKIPKEKPKINRNIMPVVKSNKTVYSCPRCQDSEVEACLKVPTKAICDCGHSFCIKCYHKWGHEKHFCLKANQELRQMEEECKEIQRKRNTPPAYPKHVQFQDDLEQEDEEEEEESEEEIDTVSKRGFDIEGGKEEKSKNNIKSEPELCPFCKDEVTKFHSRNPFKACGKEYHIFDKDERCLSSYLYMIYDILVWPIGYLLSTLKRKCSRDKEIDPSDCCWILGIVFIGAFLVLFGFIFTFVLIFCYPLLVCNRRNVLQERIINRPEVFKHI